MSIKEISSVSDRLADASDQVVVRTSSICGASAAMSVAADQLTASASVFRIRSGSMVGRTERAPIDTGTMSVRYDAMTLGEKVGDTLHRCDGRCGGFGGDVNRGTRAA
jgi:hypothetical protein